MTELTAEPKQTYGLIVGIEKQALQMKRQLLGEEHPDVATSLNNLAGLYSSQGRYSQAEPLYQQALEICERCLGVNHPNTVTCRKNFENLRLAMNSIDTDEAVDQ